VKPTPLDPPATEAEHDRASELWTLASDDLVRRGYARHLWGNLALPSKEAIIHMIRAASGQQPK